MPSVNMDEASDRPIPREGSAGGRPAIRLFIFATEDAGDRESLATAIAEAGGEAHQVPSRGLTPLIEYVLVATIAARSLVAVIGVLRSMFRTGLVIDGRSPDTLVRADDSLPKGVIVVRSGDGEVTVKVGETLTGALLACLDGRDRTTDQIPRE